MRARVVQLLQAERQLAQRDALAIVGHMDKVGQAVPLEVLKVATQLLAQRIHVVEQVDRNVDGVRRHQRHVRSKYGRNYLTQPFGRPSKLLVVSDAFTQPPEERAQLTSKVSASLNEMPVDHNPLATDEVARLLGMQYDRVVLILAHVATYRGRIGIVVDENLSAVLLGKGAPQLVVRPQDLALTTVRKSAIGIEHGAPVDDTRHRHTHGIEIAHLPATQWQGRQQVLHIAHVVKALGHTAVCCDLAAIIDAPAHPGVLGPLDHANNHNLLVICDVAHQLEVVRVLRGKDRVVGEQMHDQLEAGTRIVGSKHLRRNLHHHGIGKGLHHRFALVADLRRQQHGIKVAALRLGLLERNSLKAIVERKRLGSLLQTVGKHGGREACRAAEQHARRDIALRLLELVGHLGKELLGAHLVIELKMQEELGVVRAVWVHDGKLDDFAKLIAQVIEGHASRRMVGRKNDVVVINLRHRASRNGRRLHVGAKRGAKLTHGTPPFALDVPLSYGR